MLKNFYSIVGKVVDSFLDVVSGWESLKVVNGDRVVEADDILDRNAGV